MVCTEKLPVPPVRGGAIQTYIDGAAPHIAADHDLTIYCRRDPDLPDEELRDGIRFVRVDPGSSSLTYAGAVADRLASDPPDMLHTFNRPVMVPLYHQAAPRSRLLLSVHNEMFAPEQVALEVGAAVVHQTDAIITISDFIQRGIRRRFPAAVGKLRTIYSGVDHERFLPRWHPSALAAAAELRQTLDLGDHRVVLFVGRMTPKKGAHIVVEAIRRLQRDGVPIRLVVVGSKWYGGDDPDPYITELHASAEGLVPPAAFTGYVPYADVHRYFGLADVFVCASQWEEPLSRTHYEAMAAGLPIVTTDRGGNAEVVRGYRNGVVLKQHDDPEEMASAIRTLLVHRIRARKMGVRGRALAEHRYTWTRVAGEILDVYRRLSERRGERP